MEVALIWIIIVATAVGTGRLLATTGRRPVPPVLTVWLAAITLILSALGNIQDGVLDTLARNREALLDGQVWRIVTPLFVQDGEWSGTIFNLITLVVFGVFVESLFPRRTFLLVYFTTGIASEIAAYTVLQHQGFAGNSVAVMGLAGLLALTCARRGPPVPRIAGGIALASGILLLVTGDLHGVGFVAGAALALSTSPPARRNRHRIEEEWPPYWG